MTRPTRPLQPVGPARRHIQLLRARHHMSLRAIASAAGVDGHTIRRIAAQPKPATGRINQYTAAAILAVQPAVAGPPRGFLDATGTIRRLQALMTIGWSQRELARRLRVRQQRLNQIMRQRYIKATFAAAARRLYSELSTTPSTGPGATRTRRHAARMGWVSVMAWEDGTIDDPQAKPVLDAAGVTRYDHAKVELALAGELPYSVLSHREGAEVITRLNAAGLNDYEIAEKLHADPDTIGRRRMRLGLPHRFDPCGRMGKAAS